MAPTGVDDPPPSPPPPPPPPVGVGDGVELLVSLDDEEPLLLLSELLDEDVDVVDAVGVTTRVENVRPSVSPLYVVSASWAVEILTPPQK
jgi:hypothetical protein